MNAASHLAQKRWKDRDDFFRTQKIISRDHSDRSSVDVSEVISDSTVSQHSSIWSHVVIGVEGRDICAEKCRLFD